MKLQRSAKNRRPVYMLIASTCCIGLVVDVGLLFEQCSLELLQFYSANATSEELCIFELI